MVARAPPKRRAIGPAAKASGDTADATHGEEQADHPGRGVDLSHQKEDLDGGGDPAEQIGRCGGRRNRAQERVAEDEAQTFRDSVQQARMSTFGQDWMSVRVRV